MERIHDKPWHICASNAVTGEGLQEGVEWLTGRQIDRYRCVTHRRTDRMAAMTDYNMQSRLGTARDCGGVAYSYTNTDR